METRLARNVKAYRERNWYFGYCIYCGKEVYNPAKSGCQECRRKNNLRMKALRASKRDEIEDQFWTDIALTTHWGNSSSW